MIYLAKSGLIFGGLLSLLFCQDFFAAEGGDLAVEFRKLDENVFGQELDAQRHEATIVKLWDAFRSADDKNSILKSAPFESIVFPTQGESRSYPWDIQLVSLATGERKFTHAEWCLWLDEQKAAGLVIRECEFHQSAFDSAKGDQPATSTFNILFHADNTATRTRYVLKGPIRISWSKQKDKDGHYKIQSIESKGLTIQFRVGVPAFVDGAHIAAFSQGKHTMQLNRATHPESLLVYDVNRDGLPDVVSAGWNLLFINKGAGEFARNQLVNDSEEPVYGAVIADLNGDGRADYLRSLKNRKLQMHEGRAEGGFDPKGRAIETTANLPECLAIAAGDVDADGDVDLWVTQYKGIYGNGEMPHPSYFDANDSRPSSLLINDGKGNFTDGTESAGLSAKRTRRTYSAVLVDIDNDRDLDLINCADYCGVDLFLNDGKGKFTDVTADRFKETKAFGMSLAVADFNADGKDDIFMTGMGSTTARRLSYMKLGRPGFPEHDAMRLRMGYGNRMYLSGADSSFEEPPYKDHVARTGWSWGCSAMDFDNDGFTDLFVANGLQSGESARDFCSEFWRRDVYLSSPTPNESLDKFYSTALQDLHKGRISWNGFEHKNLLLNLGGRDFVNIAYVMGCAFEFDARSMAGVDFDLDGRTDLVLTEAGGLNKEGIHLVRNTFDSGNSWIGVHLREEGQGVTPLGAVVLVTSGGKQQRCHMLAGDSYMTQHPASKVFGLGQATSVDSVEVRWSNGKTKTIVKPEIGRYHYIRP